MNALPEDDTIRRFGDGCLVLVTPEDVASHMTLYGSATLLHRNGLTYRVLQPWEGQVDD